MRVCGLTNTPLCILVCSVYDCDFEKVILDSGLLIDFININFNDKEFILRMPPCHAPFYCCCHAHLFHLVVVAPSLLVGVACVFVG